MAVVWEEAEEDENDAEGFRKLRRALADHESAKLVRASRLRPAACAFSGGAGT